MANGGPILMSLYVYAPNKVLPIVFAILYGISAAGHIWQCYYYKCIKIVGLQPLCAILFTVGYALREYGAYNYLYSPSNLIFFIMSQVLIYVAPPLLELANYHVLGRIFHYVPHLSPFPPAKVLLTFGALMGFVEVVNSLGVSLSSNPSSKPTTQHLGSYLTIAALSMQFAAILAFVVLAAIFHRRCYTNKVLVRAVSTPLNTLYVSMALITVRCVYRLVEHLGSTSIDLDNIETLRKLSPILRYEWYFYVFEATLMLINSMIWNIWNPGRYLPKNYHVYLARDGQTEVQGNYVKDDRPLWKKGLSIWTFGLFFRAKKHPQPTDDQQYSSSEEHASYKVDDRPFVIKVLWVLSLGLLFRPKLKRRTTEELGLYQDRPREAVSSA